ncbi:hypothetical protein SAY86_002755 [Trapa natans]|uniref:DUF4378 domain-containing protein n=1 Tax=Trapa natans TaxID=22666 RepID=A0AAN7LUB0_TRANT|nr:hypothetical protein SAY86_002755 [Trapa natans]
MEKHLPYNGQYGVEHRQYRQGWLWGMIHALDYHHWQYLKKLQKLLYRKKHHTRRRKQRFICCAVPKTRSFTNDAGKELEQVDAEAEHLQDQHHIEEGEALAAEDTSNSHVLNSHVGKLNQDNPIDSEAGLTKVDDELFESILHNPRVAIVRDVARDHEGTGKPRFTKARSFPFSDSSGARHYGSSTLQHKQSEVWLSHGVDRQKIVPHSAPLKREDVVSSQMLDNRGWNHLIISQLKGIKRRIRLALKEREKGSLPAETMSDRVKEISSDQPEAKKDPKMMRLSSLNESLDRYTRLFEESFGSEMRASKLNNSRSLNLTVDGKSSSATRAFRRRLSLPDYETLSSFLSDLSYDNLHSKEVKMKSEPLNDSLRIDYPERSLEESDTTFISEGPGWMEGSIQGLYADDEIHSENSVELGRGEHVVLHGNEIDIASKTITEAEPCSPVSVLHSLDKSSTTELEAPCPSEETDLRPCINIPIKLGHHQMVEEEDDCDFNFVKGILRLGGFFESEVLEPWDSIHLPLDPKVFDHQLQAASDLHVPECSDTNSCIHQLLFDLTNEVLLEICEGNFTYFPKAFSFCKFITRPITNGQHLLEEVWTRVKRYPGIMGRGVDLKLDDTVSRDMGKGDRWMDLEWESECVTLELEDMILEELVNDLIHS